MNEKVNLQDLVSLLAQKADISKKEAEIFLKEYFSAVTDGLLKDGSVKIKKLGNFKLTQVNDRESIDINQGTRVLIPSHHKVSYTPETQLAQEINEPFSWLEPVNLDNEGGGGNEENEGNEGNEEIKILPAVNIENTQQPEAQQLIEEPEVKTEKIVVSEEIPEGDNNEEDESYESILKTLFWERYERTQSTHNQRKKNNKIFMKWISIILAIVIAAGVYLYWNKDKYFPDNEFFISSVDDDFWNEYYVKKKDSASVALHDTITQQTELLTNESLEVELPSETIIPKDTVKTPPPAPATSLPVNERQPDRTVENPPVNKPEATTPPPVKKGKERTVSAGERLASIALEEYGHRAFWVYLYEENKNLIKDPDNIPIGTEIIIPPMSKYKINKNDMESIQRANNLAEKYNK